MNRSFLIDLTKAVAMILVVVQHAWSMLGLDTDDHGLVCYAYRAIVNCGVPLFVLVSGALILTKAAAPLKDFYRRRLPRLLLPWLFWATIVYLLSLFTGAYDWFDGSVLSALRGFVPCLLENRVNEFHWFVHMIFVLYLLAPFLQRALQALTSREVLAVLGVWALGLLLLQFYPALFLTHYISSLWKYLGVFIAGYYLRTAQLSIGHCQLHIAYCILGFLSLYLLDVLTHCRIVLIEPLIAISLGLWLMNARRAERLPAPVRTFLTNTGRYSYTIYLVHIVVLRALYTGLAHLSPFTSHLSPLTSTPYTLHSTLYTLPATLYPLLPLLAAALVLAVVYLGCYIYDRIRILPNRLIGIG